MTLVVLDTDAASAFREVPLATFNLRDFTDFAEHEGLELVPTG